MLRKRVVNKKKPVYRRQIGRMIGITGGIGAGKSTVSRVLRDAGYPVLSADEIARELTAPRSPALRQIVKLFGKGAVADGVMDRAYLRAAIIENPRLRKRLEALLHPLIQKRSLALAQEFFKKGNSLVFYEAPLLFEAKSHRAMHAVICVVARDSIRIARVMKRDGGTEAHARKLLRSQLPQREKAMLSDYVIKNNGSEEELKTQTLAVLHKLTRN